MFDIPVCRTAERTVSRIVNRGTRVIQLDLLRGVAILLVLGRHVVWPATQAGVFTPFAVAWERFGWTGVDLFFVLSGFLIGGLLYEELLSTGRLRLGRFLIRRIFKIWPTFYLFVAFLLLYFYQQGPLGPDDHGAFSDKLRPLLPHLFHLQNYIGPVWLHTWSLAVEEHFYLAFPFLLFLHSRLRRSRPVPSLAEVTAVTLAALIVCGYLRVKAHPTADISFVTQLMPTHLRIDSLLFGTFLAYVYHARRNWFARLHKWRVAILLLGIAAISPMLWLSLDTVPFVSTWGFSLLYIGYGCMLVSVMCIEQNSPTMAFLTNSPPARVLARIGFSSYSIYVWHWHAARLPVIDLAEQHAIRQSPSLQWLVFTTLYVLTAAAFGIVMGKIVELPALQLRDRLFPRISGTPVQNDGAYPAVA
jgi:peptidoglycan/LPS O-acetylase OafA/YrhL